MHPEAFAYVSKVVREHGFTDAARVCEVGSFNVNGTIRGLFDTDDYVGIDVRPGPGVDVVCAGEDFHSDTPFDLCICCETLEHAEHAAAIIWNIAAHLKPEGVLILTAAGIERDPHGCNGGEVGNEFYRGVDERSLSSWLHEAGFDGWAIDTNPRAGDIYALAVMP